MENDLVLKDLFDKEANSIFTLDKILQRPYEWDDKRAIALINDILSNKHIFDGIKYNIGDFIVLINDAKPLRMVFYDGQQRLTTIHLLLYSVRNEKLNKTKQEDYRSRIFLPNGDRRLRLRDADDKLLEKILNGAEFTKEEKQTHIVKNYLKITEIFVKGKKIEDLEKDLRCILSHTSYYLRVCTTPDEGVKQFLNLNAKGQVLSESRKALGFLYDKMQKKDEDFLLTLTNMSDNISSHFYASYCYYKGLEYHGRNFQNKFVQLQSIDIIEDCKKFYNGYYDAMINNPDKFFENIQTRASLSQVYIDLFTDKYSWTEKLSTEQKKKIFKLFEWGYVSRIIDSSGSSDRKVFNGILTSKLRYNFDELQKYVIKSLTTQKRAFVSVKRLETYDVHGKNKPIIKFLLSRIEYMLWENCKENITHNDTLTIEHIYPQCYVNELNCNSNYNIGYTIGNCTLMGQRQNSSNSTKRYEDKRESYESSPYKLNQNLAKRYTQWNKKTIEDRTQWCIEQLIQFYGDWIK